VTTTKKISNLPGVLATCCTVEDKSLVYKMGNLVIRENVNDGIGNGVGNIVVDGVANNVFMGVLV
jgi:Na+-transporting NADH:ubiquinone oxidoreductase subunit NqrD